MAMLSGRKAFTRSLMVIVSRRLRKMSITFVAALRAFIDTGTAAVVRRAAGASNLTDGNAKGHGGG